MRNSGEGVFPVVLIKVDGITTRTVIDTGARNQVIQETKRDRYQAGGDVDVLPYR